MTRIRKIILSTAAVAALVFAFTAAADAKPMTCSARHTDCTSRCIMNADNYSAGNACIARTCDRQFNNCMSESSGGGERGGGGRGEGGGGGGGAGKGTGKTAGGPVVRDHRK